VGHAVSARDELAALILDTLPGAQQGDAFALADALLAAGWRAPAKRRAAVAASAAIEPFVPNTGDPRLDDFMRRRHDPRWKSPVARAKSASLRLPAGSWIGRMLKSVDHRDLEGECQVIGQSTTPREYHVVDERGHLATVDVYTLSMAAVVR
jgi:hypothetical protein